MLESQKKTIPRISPVKAFDRLFNFVILTILFFIAAGVFSLYDSEPYPWIIALFLGHLAVILRLFRQSTLIKFMVVYVHGLMTITGIVLCILVGTTDWWTSTQMFCWCLAIGFVGPCLERIWTVLGVIWLIIEMWLLFYIWWLMDIYNQPLVTHMMEPCLVRLSIIHTHGMGYFARHIGVFYVIMTTSELVWNMGSYGQWAYMGVIALSFVISYVLGTTTFMYSLFMPLLGFPCKWCLKEMLIENKDVLIFICIVVFCGGLVEYMLHHTGIFKDFLPHKSILTIVFNDIHLDSSTLRNSTCDTCQSESSLFSALQLAWNTFDSITSFIVSKDSYWVKMSNESKGIISWMFGWIQHLSSCTTVIFHMVLNVFRFFFHVVVRNWRNMQLFMGILFPVSVIILIENFTEIPAALKAIMELSKRPKEEQKNA
jgi:hypothetical protein